MHDGCASWPLHVPESAAAPRSARRAHRSAVRGAVIPGILRRPRAASRPPLVLMVPGLDSSKEELYAMENDFLRRGMATLTIDGPGQSENAPRFPIRPDWGSVVRSLLDGLPRAQGRRSRPRRADGDQHGRHLRTARRRGGEAAPCRHRARRTLRPVRMLGALNRSPRAGTSSTRSRATRTRPSEGKDAHAARRARQGDLPAAHHHGARDRLFPPAQAERIGARGAQSDPAHVSGRKPRLQQHRLQVPPGHGPTGCATSSVRSAVQPRATPLRDEKHHRERGSFWSAEESRSCARPRRISPALPDLPRSL